MTPLRQQMIEAMQQRGFSSRTHESYIYTVEQLVRYHRIPPDRLTTPQLQAFFKHLALEKELAPASCRLYLNGVRFFLSARTRLERLCSLDGDTQTPAAHPGTAQS